MNAVSVVFFRGYGTPTRSKSRGWHNGRASELRSTGRGFHPSSGCICVTTAGKLLTPTCLDADSLHYDMEPLNRAGIYLYLSKFKGQTCSRLRIPAGRRSGSSAVDNTKKRSSRESGVHGTRRCVGKTKRERDRMTEFHGG